MSAATGAAAGRKGAAEGGALENQTAEDEPRGWDAEEVTEMSKQNTAFLKASKAKKWWGGGD